MGTEEQSQSIINAKNKEKMGFIKFGVMLLAIIACAVWARSTDDVEKTVENSALDEHDTEYPQLDEYDIADDALPQPKRAKGCPGGNIWGERSPDACAYGEGDCNHGHNCKAGLVCGDNNCRHMNPNGGYGMKDDCCWKKHQEEAWESK